MKSYIYINVHVHVKMHIMHNCSNLRMQNYHQEEIKTYYKLLIIKMIIITILLLGTAVM